MRVLVVEDDGAVGAALRRGLTAEGFDIDIALDASGAMRMAAEHDYAAIVLDTRLPDRSGFRLCADLRADGIDTPILMLTAKSGGYDTSEWREAGADDAVTTPCAFVELAIRIRALLRRSGPRRASVQLVGDLEIDFDASACRRAGTSISLTNREMMLLEVLARWPGTVMTKDFLLDQVWGPDFDGGHNIVEVYVGYLRKKIDADHDVKLIQTAHGQGYRLSA